MLSLDSFSFLRFFFVIIFFLLISLFQVFLQTAYSDVSSGVIIPLYSFPDASWDEVRNIKNANPDVPFLVIINPHNGPGSEYNSYYYSGIKNFQSAEITVIGYVNTEYATKKIVDVFADIDSYKTWYTLDGIFFDEMSNVPGNESYYKNLDDYAKSQGFVLTVGNPGHDTLPSYVGTLDNLLIYENSGLPNFFLLGGWHENYDESNFSILVYGLDSLNQSFVKYAANYVDYIYLTNDHLPNPWDTIPPYFDNLVSTLASTDAQKVMTATAVSPTQIDLSWSAPLYDDISPIPNYQIDVKVGSGSWSTLVANAGTSTSYSHSDLISNTTYNYRISDIKSDNVENDNGVYLPLYTDPGNGNSLSTSWQRVYEAKVANPDVRITVATNPSSGSGSSPRLDYEYGISALRSVGVNVIGYVATNYNNGPITNADVKADIDNWVSWYGDRSLGSGRGITGINLDEMASDNDSNGFNGDNIEWYTSLTDYIKNTKGLSFVQGNPGKDTTEKYIGSVDQIKINEGGSGVPNLDDLFDGWKKNYSINNFAIIPHTVPILDEDYIRESKQYMSDIYIQDDGADGNPWDSVSTHFEKIIEILSEGSNAKGSSFPIIEVVATTHLPPVPSWIKFNAGLWSEDKIDDSKFMQGIKFLQSLGFLKLNESSIDSKIIPPWFKNNALWWSQDLISDSDFISGTEYLISSSIIIP